MGINQKISGRAFWQEIFRIIQDNNSIIHQNEIFFLTSVMPALSRLTTKPPPDCRLPISDALALLVIIGLAVLFRLSDLGDRNLWTDEAWVALAALKPTPSEAWAAGQSTPPLYLLALWTIAKLVGAGEAHLRALSFLFGLGTVLLFWPLAQRLAAPRAALLSLAALACSPIMVYYSKELKQYSGDAFFAVLILLLTELLRERQGVSGWLLLTLAGIAALGFSHPAVFVLPAAAGVLWFSLPPTRRWSLGLVGLSWVVAFGVYYVLFFRQQANPELVAYWLPGFPDFSGLGPFARWLLTSLCRYVNYFLYDWGIYWGGPLIFAGAVILVRQGQGRTLVYFGGMLLLAFAAAALHRYPFMAPHNGNRLMLFTGPLFYLVTTVGLTGILTWLVRRHLSWLAFFLGGVIILLLNPPELVRQNLRTTYQREEIKPLISYLENHLTSEDHIYIYYYAVYPFQYYYRGRTERVIWGKSCVEKDLTLPPRDAPSTSRLWLLAAHYPDRDFIQNFAARLLGPSWQQTNTLSHQGAILMLFQRTEGTRIHDDG